MRTLISVLLTVLAISVASAQNCLNFKVTANISESTCQEANVVSMKASGGEGPYSFKWNDGELVSFRENLSSGTYTCTVTDKHGCSVVKTFSFKAKPAPIKVKEIITRDANGTSVALEVTGGVKPYKYFWIGSGLDIESNQNKPKLENLKSGMYRIVVQDANQCNGTLQFEIKK